MSYNSEYSKQYYITHKNIFRERGKRWVAKNPGKVKEARQRSKRTVKGWLTKVYSSMKRASKDRNMDLPNFTKQELWDWIYNNYSFVFPELFNIWVVSGCLKEKVPSLNRLDDFKSYSLDNLELVTWDINNKKGSTSIKAITTVHQKLGIIAKELFSRPVIQKDKTGKIINSFPSVRDASRHISGTDHSTISKVCRKELKSHKGFVWVYSNDK